MGFAEVARGIYGFGLLTLGGAFLVLLVRGGPVALLVVRELAASLREHSAAMRGTAAAESAVAEMRRKVDEIHAAVVK